MPIRRLTLRLLVALMTSLSLLHLSLEGGGVCSSSRADGAQSTMAMSGADSHAGHGLPAASTAHDRSDLAQQENGRHAPAQERCCKSMSGCDVTTVAIAVTRVVAPWPASRLPAYTDSMLASVAAAPEPPPPKA